VKFAFGESRCDFFTGFISIIFLFRQPPPSGFYPFYSKRKLLQNTRFLFIFYLIYWVNGSTRSAVESSLH